jgi:hypothetical protein
MAAGPHDGRSRSVVAPLATGAGLVPGPGPQERHDEGDRDPELHPAGGAPVPTAPGTPVPACSDSGRCDRPAGLGMDARMAVGGGMGGTAGAAQRGGWIPVPLTQFRPCVRIRGIRTSAWLRRSGWHGWESVAGRRTRSRDHGLQADEVRDAVVCVRGLTFVWADDSERGRRALVETFIRGVKVMVVLYPASDALGDAYHLGSAIPYDEECGGT